MAAGDLLLSLAYQRGYSAGLRGRGAGQCPYEGHNDGSLALQLQWMDGHFDAVTGVRIVAHKRPYRTRRKSVRVRWPRSRYARLRLETIIHSQTRGN